MNPYKTKDDVEQMAICHMNIQEYEEQLEALTLEIEDLTHKTLNMQAMIDEEYNRLEGLRYGR